MAGCHLRYSSLDRGQATSTTTHETASPLSGTPSPGTCNSHGGQRGSAAFVWTLKGASGGGLGGAVFAKIILFLIFVTFFQQCPCERSCLPAPAHSVASLFLLSWLDVVPLLSLLLLYSQSLNSNISFLPLSLLNSASSTLAPSASAISRLSPCLSYPADLDTRSL